MPPQLSSGQQLAPRRPSGVWSHQVLFRAPRLAGGKALQEVALDVVEAYPLLLHGVAGADGDRVVVEGLEVDGDAVRRTDLVLSPVAAADRTGVVELHVPPGAQQ